MGAFGARTYNSITGGEKPDTHEPVYQEFAVEVTIVAPSAEIADHVDLTLRQHLTSVDPQDDVRGPIPWLTYHPLYEHMTWGISLEAIRAAEEKIVQEALAWRAYRRLHPDEAYQPQTEQKVSVQAKRLAWIASALHNDTILGRDKQYQRVGQTLRWRGTSWTTSVLYGLPAFGAWLNAQGCTVSCAFTELR
jgi:hypothetical protein